MSATSVHNDYFKVFCLEFFHTLWSYDHWIHFGVTVNSHKRESMIRFGEQMKYNRNAVVFMSMFVLPPIKGYSGFCCILLELVKGTFKYKQNKYFFSRSIRSSITFLCKDCRRYLLWMCRRKSNTSSILFFGSSTPTNKKKLFLAHHMAVDKTKQTNTIPSGNNSATSNRHSQGLKTTVNMDNSN